MGKCTGIFLYLASNAGFTNIVEKVVIHQARKYGKTKFGMERFINGFLDLIHIWFISKFGRRPMHFLVLRSYYVYDWIGVCFLSRNRQVIYESYQDDYCRQTTEFLSLYNDGIGSQFFVAGFLGEIVLQSRTK